MSLTQPTTSSPSDSGSQPIASADPSWGPGATAGAGAEPNLSPSPSASSSSRPSLGHSADVPSATAATAAGASAAATSAASAAAAAAPVPPPASSIPLARHRWHEDVQALLVGTLFVALGVVLFRHAGLLTGGTAGLAFLLHYATGWNFSLVFFAINLPFYLLAWQRMGRTFTLKTLAAVSLLSVLAEAIPHWLGIEHLATPYAAVMGGLLAGTGMLILFRHRASLGGLNVLVLWLQDKRGWRAGHVQMGLDCSIVLVAMAFVPLAQLLWSIVGAVALNLTLAINHRPGRYMAV